MINMNLEKDKKLSTKEICTIEDLAIQAAMDGGFVNRYVFERAIWVFTALSLLEESKKEGLRQCLVDADVCAAFDYMIIQGITEELANNYSTDIELILSVSTDWIEDVTRYEQSPRGIVDSLSSLSGDIVNSAIQRLEEIGSNENLGYIQNIATQWGYGRDGKADVLNFPEKTSQE